MKMDFFHLDDIIEKECNSVVHLRLMAISVQLGFWKVVCDAKYMNGSINLPVQILHA